MTTFRSLLPLVLLAALMPSAIAQDANKAHKTVLGPSAALLESWNDIGRKLIAMAEDFPEDKYDFKPTPAQRTFAEGLLHVAGANYYFINPATGRKAPDGDPKRADYKTKADVVAYVKKSFGEGADLIKQRGDKGMSETMPDVGGEHLYSFGDLAWGTVEHSGEHYGQLVVYYRVAGLVPPESRPKK
jgi:uncharacterized damage-inducible protein DinB